MYAMNMRYCYIIALHIILRVLFKTPKYIIGDIKIQYVTLFLHTVIIFGIIEHSITIKGFVFQMNVVVRSVVCWRVFWHRVHRQYADYYNGDNATISI